VKKIAFFIWHTKTGHFLFNSISVLTLLWIIVKIFHLEVLNWGGIGAAIGASIFFAIRDKNERWI
jgi:hypothetical protein